MADFNEQTKAELIAQLSQARGQMTRSASAVAESLNVPRNLRRSFNRNRTGWLAGAAISGWLLSRLPARKRKLKIHPAGQGTGYGKESSRSGLLLGLLKFSASLAQPAITALAKDKLGALIRKRQAF